MLPLAATSPAHNMSSRLSRTPRSVTLGATEGELEVRMDFVDCTGNTASVASAFADVDAIEINEASKLAPFRAGDRRVSTYPRIYVEADAALPNEAIRPIAVEPDQPNDRVAGVPCILNCCKALFRVVLFYELR